ncbi:thyrostimulin alpha-2 subunit [Anthonomus grandis grandis]|uniref:thyrostimulin alpha-2 subunit n=1 Tax=Anthonomus grandis grandis TaxID=2921223 RepID=UPI002165C060|nr:thyrostimulin alpha-2 subunit [Anthonomus grandis grandis]
MLVFYFFFLVILCSNGLTLNPVERDGDWHKPGCHKVGHTRKISIRDCVSFDITTNACRGFCESWAIPSDPQNSQITQPVTSIGACCNIMETEPMEVRVLCKDGIRTFVFKSAVNCDCYHCKKD